MWKPALILLLVFGVTIAVLWLAVHALRKVLHIKESGIDPGAAGPAPGSPYHADTLRRARAVWAGVAAAAGAILALLALG